MMRCILSHLDLWDPSPHALLSVKHLLTALRLEPAPTALAPRPLGANGAVVPSVAGSMAGDDGASAVGGPDDRVGENPVGGGRVQNSKLGAEGW